MLEYLEHHIVDQCNLKCTGCSHFSNFCEDWFETIEEFTTDFKRLSILTKGRVGNLRIMGGEPLMHPNVNDFLIKARELFPFSKIELVTNGLLIKKRKEELLDVCNKYGIYICVSDYGLINIPKQLEGFKYIRFYSKKEEMYNLCLDPDGKQDNVASYNGCDMHNYKWYYFQRGRFYPCCVMGNIHFFNEHFKEQLKQPIWTSLEDVSISVHDHSLKEIKEFLSTPIEACKFCDVENRHNTYHPFSVSKGDISEWITPQ